MLISFIGLGLSHFSECLASGGHGFAAVMAMWFVRVWSSELPLRAKDVVPTNNPEKVTFGSANVTLARRHQGEFVIGCIEGADMAELVAAILL
jgi:hypothetical protein